MRRDGTFPPVNGITLSKNFSSADPSKCVIHLLPRTFGTNSLDIRHGDITFYVQASTVPGLSPGFAVPPPSPDPLSKRMWVSSTSAHLDALHSSAALASRPASTRSDVHSKSSQEIPFNFTTPTISLFNSSFDCPQNGEIPAYSGAVNVGLGGEVNGSLAFGFAYAGSPFVPSDFEFALATIFNSTIDVTLSLDASLTVRDFFTPIQHYLDGHEAGFTVKQPDPLHDWSPGVGSRGYH